MPLDAFSRIIGMCTFQQIQRKVIYSTVPMLIVHHHAFYVGQNPTRACVVLLFKYADYK
jgi:hypothetical protein